MDVAEELPPCTEGAPEADNGLRLRHIKTNRGSSCSPEKLGQLIPSTSYLEETWEDEPMTPAGRVFAELNINFVCVCILAFKNRIDRVKFKAHLELTLMKHKRFASRVETRNGRPWWTQVKTNVDDHVVEAQLTPEQKKDSECVMNYTTDVILAQPLDQSRPLWDIHLLDAKLGEAEGCCVVRIHHSLGDGTSLISLLMACSRNVGKPDMLPSVPTSQAGKRSSVSAATSSSVVSRLLLAIHKFVLVFWYSLTEIAKAGATLAWVRDSSTILKPAPGIEHLPKTYRFVTVSVDDLKYVSSIVGVTINDVFMAMVARGLRRYLEYRASKELKSEGINSLNGEHVTGIRKEGQDVMSKLMSNGNRVVKSLKADGLREKLDCLRIRAVALINMRSIPGLQELSDMMDNKASQSRWGNHMGYLLAPLPMKLHSDPLELLRETKAIGIRKKSSLEGPFSYATGNLLMKILGQKAAASVVYRATLQTSISLSNVRGPSEYVMFADNPIIHIIPSVTGPPHALTVHLQSYNGEIALVAMAIKKLIPDVEYFLQLCVDALQEMKKAATEKERTDDIKIKRIY